MVEILVIPDKDNPQTGMVSWGDKKVKCALGKGGFSDDKLEGDGATPLGRFPLRHLLYRPDRESVPETGLSVFPLSQQDGWCDAPSDIEYNKAVHFPYHASCEQMWRHDHLYDIVVILGYNDEPVEPNKGSAIFLHLAREDYLPSEGCICLRRDDLLSLLKMCDNQSFITIKID